MALGRAPEAHSRGKVASVRGPLQSHTARALTWSECRVAVSWQGNQPGGRVKRRKMCSTPAPTARDAGNHHGQQTCGKKSKQDRESAGLSEKAASSPAKEHGRQRQKSKVTASCREPSPAPCACPSPKPEKEERRGSPHRSQQPGPSPTPPGLSVPTSVEAPSPAPLKLSPHPPLPQG